MNLKRLRTPNTTRYMTIYTHRTYIGILGFLLPILCLIFSFNQNGMLIQRSISACYHTRARDLFVAGMVGVSIFLFSYKGYDLQDRVITYIAGVAAALATLFPTTVGYSPADPVEYVGVLHLTEKTSGLLHIIFALILFSVFAVQCLALFTKSHTRWRNTVYRICGIIIAVSLFILIIFFAIRRSDILHKVKMVFILEALMLAAFGVAWMVKGRIFMKMKTTADGR